MRKDRALVDIELGQQNELHILLGPKMGHCREVQVLFVFGLEEAHLEPVRYHAKMKFEIDGLPVLQHI